MKANELMLGDYVYIYTFPNDNPKAEDLYPAIIVSILDGLPTEQLQTIECIIPHNNGGYGVASRPIDTCIPISLTPEILEKNGFKIEIAEYTPNWKRCILNPNFFLEDRLKGCYHFNGNNLAKINYVHELQHALKLCGIEKEIELWQQ